MQIRQNQQFCAQMLHAHRRLGLACWGWLLLGSLLWLLELLAAALVLRIRNTLPVSLLTEQALLWRLVDLPRFGGALLPSLAYLTGAVLLIAAAGYAVDAVYQRLYRLLRLPALETKLDALTACILQRIVGSEKA